MSDHMNPRILSKLRAATAISVVSLIIGLIVHAVPTEAMPSAAHFPTLPPHSALPSGSACARMVTPSPETKPNNIPFNQTTPTPDQLALFRQHPVFGSNPPAEDFMGVDGQYTGSTDMILRWAACKWGINEDVVRAQAWTESKWIQGGPSPTDGAGDKRNDPGECIQGDFRELWGYRCPGCCYQSWGILQTKVYYSWGTWPMIKDSTAFNADYRYAEQRACMNGDDTGYFGSRQQQPNTYASDLGDTNRMLWGCIGMHFSGRWYDAAAQRYINEVQENLSSKPWLALHSTALDP